MPDSILLFRGYLLKMKAANYFVQHWFILFKTVRQAETRHKENICFPNYNHTFACEEIALHCSLEHKFVGWGAIVDGYYLTFRKQLIVTDIFTVHLL